MTRDGQHTLHETISEPSGATKIKTIACLGGLSFERNVPLESIGEYIVETGNVLWMDVQDPHMEEVPLLLAEFGSFHPLALKELAQGRQRPKVEAYKGYDMVVTYSVVPQENNREFRLVEVDLFIGSNYVISVHRDPIPALDDALNSWMSGGAMLQEGAGFLIYSLLDALIDAYFPVLNDIEDQMQSPLVGFSVRPHRETIENLLFLKRTLFRLRRVLFPMREAFHILLKREQPLFSEQTLPYAYDVYERTLRLMDVLETEVDMVGGTLTTYLALMSNRLSLMARTLTMTMVAIATSGLVLGALGMSLEVLQLTDSPRALWIIWGSTVVLIMLVITALLYSRRRGWL